MVRSGYGHCAGTRLRVRERAANLRSGQKGPYIRLASLLHGSFLQKDERGLGGAPIMRNGGASERNMCEDEAPGTNLRTLIITDTGRGIRWASRMSCRNRPMGKKTLGVSTLPRCPFPSQLILMLVQTYLNANSRPPPPPRPVFGMDKTAKNSERE